MAIFIFSNLTKRMSDEDMMRICAAYNLATEAHKEQKRKTGEPYIIHSSAVASIDFSVHLIHELQQVMVSNCQN